MSISALISVYNEESRIEASLRSLQWCDEIIVLDKNSTDQTKLLAENLGAKVFNWEMTEFDTSEIPFLFDKCTTEWILTWTASDIIHPELARRIKELTEKENFEYDMIQVPFYTYILGIDSKRSPWHTEMKSYVFRKKALKLNTNGVHDAIQFLSTRTYVLKMPEKFCIYHLTHVDVNTMMERHTRYLRAEARYFNEENLKTPLKKIIREFLKIILKRKTFLLGKDGLMLAFAFLSYYMMSYVYKWEKKYSKAEIVYKGIKDEVLAEWDKSDYSS